MRVLLLVALAALAAVPPPAAAQGQEPPAYVGATITADYETQYQVFGRLEDADGRPLARHPMRVEIDGPDGPVVRGLDILTSCWGDFDPFWELRNVSERMTAKVTVDGTTFTQGLDRLHRRNDFPIRLDRTGPPTDPACADEAPVFERRVTVVGQVLKPSAPYRSHLGNTLYAQPVSGVPVHVRFTTPEGQSREETVYANGDGAYKYSVTLARAPVVGNVSVRFEDEPGVWHNASVDASTVKYVVLSRPGPRADGADDVPAPALAALAAAVAAAAGARRRRA